MILIFLLNLSTGTFAQDQSAFSVRNKTRLIKPSEAGDDSGKFSLTRTSISLNNVYNLYNKLPVEFDFKIANFYLDDNSTVDLPNTLQEKAIKLGVNFPAPFTESEKMFVGLNVIPSWNSAGKHDFADEAFQINFIGSLIYKQNNDFIVAYGLWLKPEYDTAFLPFFGVLYRATDKLTFNFLSAEPSVTYEINERTRVLLEFDFLWHEFEVTKGSQKGDKVHISDWEVGLGLEHDFNKNFKGLISIGWAFDQKYGYLNSERSVAVKDTMYAGYKISASF